MQLAGSASSLQAEIQRRKRNKFFGFFPAEGPRRRELYAKHIEFFAAGAQYKERLFMAANRVGKTESGAFETVCHLTGLYPDWWPGYRFRKPVEAWACGTTSETTRDIVQAKLMGAVDDLGTGMIPGDLIAKTTQRRGGLTGALESIWVRHVSGGTSLVGLKTYQQGRKSFEGTAKDLIWCDEEPPADCYTEMLYRTVTTRGIALITFTPLQGMSTTVKSFVEPEKPESAQYKWYIQAGWRDVPHIDEAEKAALLATTLPYQIKARTEGEPSLGAGAIYPVAQSDVECAPFEIPAHWPRVFALDVGWNRTAALWGAWDREKDCLFLYDEHYQSGEAPGVHADAIKVRGKWIPGVLDPAARGRQQHDGERLVQLYRAQGLNLTFADNSVEAGIYAVWQRIVGGRIKAFTSLKSFWSEFARYHRDEAGKIVKKDDHLMDDLRYLVMSGMRVAIVEPPPKAASRERQRGGGTWMA